MSTLTKENIQGIVREELTPLAANVATLTGKVASLTVDVAEVKADVKETKTIVDTILQKVDGFLQSIEREETERTTSDVQVERRVEQLEHAVFPRGVPQE